MRYSVHLCIYVYSVYGMYVFMLMCIHMSVCACVGQQSRSGVFFRLSCSFPCSLRHCFSLNLKLAGLAMLAANELQGAAPSASHSTEHPQSLTSMQPLPFVML